MAAATARSPQALCLCSMLVQLPNRNEAQEALFCSIPTVASNIRDQIHALAQYVRQDMSLEQFCTTLSGLTDVVIRESFVGISPETFLSFWKVVLDGMNLQLAARKPVQQGRMYALYSLSGAATFLPEYIARTVQLCFLQASLAIAAPTCRTYAHMCDSYLYIQINAEWPAGTRFPPLQYIGVTQHSSPYIAITSNSTIHHESDLFYLPLIALDTALCHPSQVRDVRGASRVSGIPPNPDPRMLLQQGFVKVSIETKGSTERNGSKTQKTTQSSPKKQKGDAKKRKAETSSKESLLSKKPRRSDMNGETKTTTTKEEKATAKEEQPAEEKQPATRTGRVLSWVSKWFGRGKS